MARVAAAAIPDVALIESWPTAALSPRPANGEESSIPLIVVKVLAAGPRHHRSQAIRF